MNNMLNLRGINQICVLGAGTAGWFTALELRRVFDESVNITVVSSPEVPIVGVGEGGILNFIETLRRLDIPFIEFMQETGAVHKLGFVYEGWRKGNQDKQDYYYHMFPSFDPDKLWIEHGYYPLLSALTNHGIPVSYIVDSISLREKNTSQEALTHMFRSEENRNFASSFHFDTYKVGQYLKKLAIKRGIFYKEGLVKDIAQNSESGLVESINVDDEIINLDFLVDASGFARLALGKKLKAKWQTFADYLPMNTAIPFHLKHQHANPDLVTRSTAMNAGWVWQIPLQHRIGAGYVFNKDFLTPDQAVDELEQWLGHEIEPIRTIHFEAGCFEEVWQGNVLAVGLASGFVEPLEATSIGQMLMQISTFADLVVDSHGVISQSTIDYFNKQNLQSWHGIRDFIRMHYDTGRTDTAFWQSTQHLPMSEEYKELKRCWQYRTPREIDFVHYAMAGFSHFGIYSWLAVGQAIGVIPPQSTVPELLTLQPEQRQKLAQILNNIKHT